MLRYCNPGLQALAAGGGDAGRRATALLDKLGAL